MNRPLGENCAAYSIHGLVAIPISCAIRPFPVPPILILVLAQVLVTVCMLVSLFDTDNSGFAEDKLE